MSGLGEKPPLPERGLTRVSRDCTPRDTHRQSAAMAPRTHRHAACKHEGILERLGRGGDGHPKRLVDGTPLGQLIHRRESVAGCAALHAGCT